MSITDVILCSDHLCHCPAPSHFIYIFYDDIVSFLVDTGDKCIPRCKPPGKRVPGWNDQVRDYRDASIFWDIIWQQCGSPLIGDIAQIRRIARGAYKRARCKVARKRESIIATKMAESLNSDTSRNFWTESKKINSLAKPSPSYVDGHTGDDVATTHLH